MIVPLNPVSSSNIAAAGYEPVSQTLAVQFSNGATHHYADVPKGVYDDFNAADSKGRFFAANIRNQFESTRVDDSSPAA